VLHDETTSYVFHQFKHDAALLVLDQSYPVVGASRSQGLVKRRYDVGSTSYESDGGTPKSITLTPEQQKIQQLEARINRLERETAILKKC